MLKKIVKQSLRKVAIKILDMDFDVEERKTEQPISTRIDQQKIPKIVDGSGDTPGPNHKTAIGRPWLSAQLTSNVHPFCIDIRPPNEVVAGMLPQAHLFPKETVKHKLDSLPAKEDRIVVYDQTGEGEAEAIAEYLRSQGWVGARNLVGGFAEWLEYDEEIERPLRQGEYQIGDAILWHRSSSKQAYVIAIEEDTLELWSADDGFLGRINLNALP